MVVVPGVKQVQSMLAGREGRTGGGECNRKKSGEARRNRVQYIGEKEQGDKGEYMYVHESEGRG